MQGSPVILQNKRAGSIPALLEFLSSSFLFVPSLFNEVSRCFLDASKRYFSLFVLCSLFQSTHPTQGGTALFLGVRSGFDGVFSWFPLGSFCCEVQNPVPVLLGFMPPGAGEQLPDSLENHLGQLPFLRFVSNLDFHGLPPFVKIWVRVGKSYPRR